MPTTSAGPVAGSVEDVGKEPPGDGLAGDVERGSVGELAEPIEVDVLLGVSSVEGGTELLDGDVVEDSGKCGVTLPGGDDDSGGFDVDVAVVDVDGDELDGGASVVVVVVCFGFVVVVTWQAPSVAPGLERRNP